MTTGEDWLSQRHADDHQQPTDCGQTGSGPKTRRSGRRVKIFLVKTPPEPHTKLTFRPDWASLGDSTGYQQHPMLDVAAVSAGPERGRGGTNSVTGHHGRPAEIAMLPTPTSHPHRPRRFAFPEPRGCEPSRASTAPNARYCDRSSFGPERARSGTNGGCGLNHHPRELCGGRYTAVTGRSGLQRPGSLRSRLVMVGPVVG